MRKVKEGVCPNIQRRLVDMTRPDKWLHNSFSIFKHFCPNWRQFVINNDYKSRHPVAASGISI